MNEHSHYTIKEISPKSQHAQALFKLLDAHNLSHCPPEICHLTQPDELAEADSILFGVSIENALLGMGGLKFFDDYAEVTRMFVKDEARGRGLGRIILKRLEKEARNRNLTMLKLETSDKFEAAVHLYKNYGFTICPPFGEYIHKAHNTYMQLDIQ